MPGGDGIFGNTPAPGGSFLAGGGNGGTGSAAATLTGANGSNASSGGGGGGGGGAGRIHFISKLTATINAAVISPAAQ
jgi:hypothetical protein